MAKAKTVYYCQNCGTQSSQWLGKCPSCNQWNTFVEEVIARSGGNDPVPAAKPVSKPVPVQDIVLDTTNRSGTGSQELDRVLGGGLVAGSLVLVGGEPGIGKSTLMLQAALNMQDRRVLYVSGEESDQQIRMRAERIGIGNPACYILNETATRNIFQHIQALSPSLVIIDSIQTLTTDIIDASAGSISQIRECASEMQRFAKSSGVPVFLVGHITKDGLLAGPKVLEHMVDTVLHFEGDRHYGYRILRSVKNRFGSTAELGIFEMGSNGLREISNPSEILLSHSTEQLSGIAIGSTMEGLRPMLIEVQALVSTSAYGTPQRSSTGFDLRRLGMLLAVLEKRGGFRLGNKDVFLNIAGGIRVDDPSLDLAVVAAIVSSAEDIPVSSKTCLAAEVGLSGEIRAVSRIDQRLSEAAKLGFERMIVSAYHQKNIQFSASGFTIPLVRRLDELFSLLFG
ncbi:MAG TPA: DNA repair protein RadA [Bacteroidales bacterium]|nr:DNA repair protein RadA [Bacteroidales bacterium]HSA42144.1 DNA repair protein RadA [Bacteroidales bacterium]